MTILTVVYDLRYAPVTFDASTFLVIANAFKQAQGYEKLHVWFLGGTYRSSSPRDVQTSVSEKNWRVHHILSQIPLLIRNTTVTTSFDQIEYLRFPIFPDFYNPSLNGKSLANAYSALYSMRNLLKYHPSSVDLLPFSAPDISPAGSEITRLMPTVTITIRASKFNTELNSDLNAWAKFAAYVQNRGYKVVVIPDFEDLFTHKKIYEYFPRDIIHEASCYSLLVRAKMYETSVHNFGVSSGVMSILWYSKNSYSLWLKTRDNIKTSTPRFLNDFHGIVEGGKPLFSMGNQHWLWQEDTVDNLINQFSKVLL